MLRHAWRSAPIPTSRPHASQREQELVRGRAPENVHTAADTAGCHQHKKRGGQEMKGNKQAGGVAVPDFNRHGRRVFNRGCARLFMRSASVLSVSQLYGLLH